MVAIVAFSKDNAMLNAKMVKWMTSPFSYRNVVFSFHSPKTGTTFDDLLYCPPSHGNKNNNDNDDDFDR